MVQNLHGERQSRARSVEFIAPLALLFPSLLFITHRLSGGQKSWFPPLPRNSQTQSSVQGDNIFWMYWQPQEKTTILVCGVRLRGMNGVLQELGVQSDAIFRVWVLAAPNWQIGRAPNVISILVFRTRDGSSNRNNVNRWWFGPQVSQIAVSGLHYQLNRLL